MARLIPVLAAVALLAGVLGAYVLAPSRAEGPVDVPARVRTGGPDPVLAAGGSFADCEECPDMIVVPAGSFTMGSPEHEDGRNSWEGPQHVVTIARPFALGRFEVTVDQFATFVKETGYQADGPCWTLEKGKLDSRQERSWRDPGFHVDGSYPAVCLSWSDAKAYVDWLSKKTGKDYRLPSEAEWEYAARSRTTPGSGPRYGFGNDAAAICANGNGFDQTGKKIIPGTTTWSALYCFDGYAYAAPVGKFAPNQFGLHDMLGNAKEWTADCYQQGPGYRGAPIDGSAWTVGDCRQRVQRGGSWLSYARLLRVAFRYKGPPDERVGDVGLRVARTL
jgi:formylglycine-generating enzyme required for sulfatase activity